ncbi:hypothetical protein LQW54_008859 [Pestalotiopsis sp. IQ-011]
MNCNVLIMMTAPGAGSQAAAESLGDTPRGGSQPAKSNAATSTLGAAVARAVAANGPDVDTKPAVVCITGITGLVAALLV